MCQRTSAFIEQRDVHIAELTVGLIPVCCEVVTVHVPAVHLATWCSLSGSMYAVSVVMLSHGTLQFY